VGYKIKRAHPAVLAVTPDDAAARGAFLALLTLIERTVPIDRIWLDVTEKPGGVGLPQTSIVDDELADAARALAAMLMRKGVSRETAIERVSRLDPYCTMPGFAATLALHI